MGSYFCMLGLDNLFKQILFLNSQFSCITFHDQLFLHARLDSLFKYMLFLNSYRSIHLSAGLVLMCLHSHRSGDPAYNWQQKMFCEVKAAAVMLTSSSIKCHLVYKKMVPTPDIHCSRCGKRFIFFTTTLCVSCGPKK